MEEFRIENIAIRFLGDISALPKDLRELIVETRDESQYQTGMILNIALNYGGRAELLSAVKAIAQDVKNGTLLPEQIDESLIESHLDTAGQPDPDLIIRPSGEFRTSNFLLWQSAYAEYVFLDEVLWPDFTPEHLESALEIYAHRNRRFGGVSSK